MAYLTLSLIFSSYSFSGEMPELDQHLKTEFLTVLKDVEVEKKLDSSAEFNECRGKYDDYKKDDAAKDKVIKDSVDCFKKKLSQSSKNGEALKKLSEDLKLVEFGLVKSNSVTHITDYLTNKMIKSLTGRDPNEKDPEKIKQQMAFNNQKMVDHKVFIDLHKNMLIKSALMEVSKFCFEKLRLTSPSNSGAADITTHWGPSWGSFPMIKDAKGKNIPNVALIDDSGKPSFLASSNADYTKKEDVYQQMIKGLGSDLDPNKLEDFFNYCKETIPVLCEDFKNKNTKPIDQSINDSTNSGMTKGAAACLSMEKIRSIREAVSQTKKIEENLKDQGDTKVSLEIEAKFYGNGNNAGEESIDKLSTLTSDDMLSNISADKELQDKLKKCQQDPSDKDCEKYLLKEDNLDKSLFAVERELNFRREVEIQRIDEIKKDPKKLTEYLESNGYYDLLKKYQENPQQVVWDEEINKIFESKKLATIQALKEKVGRRQVTDEQYKDLEKNNQVGVRITENMQETLEEKTRLAQLVLFNNIITSQLKLNDKSSQKNYRNVSGWLKEQSVIEGLNQGSYNPNLFSGIKDMAKKEGNAASNSSIDDGGILEDILGKD